MSSAIGEVIDGLEKSLGSVVRWLVALFVLAVVFSVGLGIVIAKVFL
jgi:hypothetical protein